MVALTSSLGPVGHGGLLFPASGTGATGPLDAYTTDLLFAGSTARRLLGAFAGASGILRVRESGGSTEANVGLTGAAVMDEIALLAHTGANSGYLRYLRDQSAAAYDFGHATASVQPRIVSAGTIDTANSQPAARFDGVNDCWDRADTCGYTFGPLTMIAVVKLSDATARRAVCIIGQSGSGSNYIGIEGKTFLSAGNNWGVYLPGSDTYESNLPLSTSLAVVCLRVSSTTAGSTIAGTVALSLNGTAATTLTATAGNGLWGAMTGMNAVRVGGYPGGGSFYLYGWLPELMIWNRDIGATAEAAIVTNCKTYYSIL